MLSDKDISYADAVEKVMQANGGFASLRHIYKEIWRYKDKSKTKGKSLKTVIRGAVRTHNRFVRIDKGIYAFKSLYKSELSEVAGGKKEERRGKERREEKRRGKERREEKRRGENRRGEERR